MPHAHMHTAMPMHTREAPAFAVAAAHRQAYAHTQCTAHKMKDKHNTHMHHVLHSHTHTRVHAWLHAYAWAYGYSSERGPAHTSFCCPRLSARRMRATSTKDVCSSAAQAATSRCTSCFCKCEKRILIPDPRMCSKPQWYSAAASRQLPRSRSACRRTRQSPSR